MATYSFHIKSQPITKYGNKLDAAAHFDYIDREGQYKNREDLIASGSSNMPEWSPTPYHYWEAASLYERKNGNAYREITWALPSELPDAANEKLVKEFCEQTFGDKFTYSYAIHSKESSDPEHDNVHVHIMFNERELTKDREYDNPEDHFARYTESNGVSSGYKKEEAFRKKAMIYTLRERAATLTNQYYEKYYLEERVDHRSFKDQQKALLEAGRFSEAAKFDNVKPQKRVPAAQYYKEKNHVKEMGTVEINKIHNELAKEMRLQKDKLYQNFYKQDVIYVANIKDYFGDLKYNADKKIQDFTNQINALRKDKVSDKALDTWAKNQIVKGYSKRAKQLNSFIKTGEYKNSLGELSFNQIEELKAAKKELAALEAKIPHDQLQQKKEEILHRNHEIDITIKSLYAKIKPLEGTSKKYARILDGLQKIPSDQVVALVKPNGIIIKNNSINNNAVQSKQPTNRATISKLPNPNQERPFEKSYDKSVSKRNMINSLASKIERKLDSLAISNKGGFIAKKELTLDDLQEMLHNGLEL